MVGIQSSLGMAAYGRTAQLGNAQADRARADNDKQAALKELDKKQAEANDEAPFSARDIRPPEAANRSEEPEVKQSAPPRGSMVDIAV